MIKVISAGSYKGKYQDKEYEKVMLVYSVNGQYPKCEGVDPLVYAKAVEENDNKPLSRAKEVRFLREERYGKYPITKIEVIKE